MNSPIAARPARSITRLFAALIAAVALFAVVASGASAQQDNFLNGNASIAGTTTFGNATYVPNAVAPVVGAVPQGATSLTMGAVRNGSGGTNGIHRVGFSTGRLVMIYQSNGVTGTPTSGDQSAVTLSSATAGHWEFARLSTFTAPTLNFTAPLIYSYPAGTAQVIAVPEYDDVTLSSTNTRIDAQSWDGSSGGVLVMLAQGTVNFSGNGAEMRATGLGFRGGASWVDNPSELKASSGECATTQMNGATLTSPLAFKGEGFYSSAYTTSNPVTDVKQIGRGNYLQAGGGGSCFNASGGGGSNAGAGGVGGNTLDQAEPGGDNDRAGGGLGGAAISFDATAQMPFGGGGGAGDRDDSNSTAGANGGGVVMLRGGNLTGRPRLTANGNTATSGATNPYDGAGGGGAGGVAIARMSGTVNCTNTSWISAAGGNGANAHSNGSYEWTPGGGGGGGRTYLQGSSITGNCGPNSNAGTRGTGSARGAANGSAGTSTSNATPMALPVIAITSPSGNPTVSDNTPTITGTGTPGAVAYVYADNSFIGTTTITGGGNWSFTPSTPLSDGGHTITAFSMKADGMSSDLASAGITIDTTPPAAPTINTGPTGFTSNNDPSFTFTGAEPGGTYQCYVNPPSATWTACTSPSSYTNLADGAHTFAVRQIDAVGNIGPAATRSFTIDTVAPTVSLTSPANGSTYNTTTPPLNFSVTDANPGTSQCSIDGGAWATCTSGTNLAALGQGSHTIQVRNTDLAGNIGVSATNTFTIDSIAPGAPAITSPADNSFTNDQTPTISGDSAEANSTVKVYNGLTLICQTTADGSGNWSCTPGSNLAEGSYTFEATSTDGAGNESARSNAVDVTIDVTAPAAPSISSPSDGSTIGDNTPHVTGGGAVPNGPVTVYEGNTVLCTTTADGSGNWSCDTSSLSDGPHTLTATTEDPAGNESPTSSPVSVTIDTTAPLVSLSAPANNASYSVDNPVVTFTLTETNPGTTTCTVTGPGGPYNVSPCTSGQNLPNLPDGSFSIQVSHVDDAGNSGSSATHNFTIDTTAPAAPAITSPADNTVTSDATPTISGNGAEPGSTVKVYDGLTVICSGTADGSGNWTCTPGSNLPDGPYAFTATSTDTNGNESGASNTVNVTIDTTAPGAPAITSPADGTSTNDQTPTISGDSAEANSTVKVYNGVTLICQTTADGAGNWSCTPGSNLAEGSYTFEATSTDTAGNESVRSNAVDVTIDVTAPATPQIDSPADNSFTSDTTPTISGSGAESGSTVTVYDALNNVICTDVADGSGNWSCDASPALAEGAYTFTAKAVDAAGNESGVSNAVDLTVDTTAPTVSLTTPANGVTYTTTTPPLNFSVTDTNSGTSECNIDNGGWNSCTSGTNLAALGQGSHTIQVRNTDLAGNIGVSATNTFTIDSIAPGAPAITSPADGTSTNDQTPTISGDSAEANSTVKVYNGVTLICQTTADGSGNWSCTPGSNLAEGNYTFEATSTDGAGNEGPRSNAVDVTIDVTAPAAPSISSPSDGSTIGDNTPHVTGGGAVPNGPVTVYEGNTVLCTTTADGSGNWSCDTSSLSDGPHTLTATTEDPAGNESPTSSPVDVTIDTAAPGAPAITSPADGTSTNDQTPTISGDSAEANSTVKVYNGVTLICQTTADGSGNWSCTPGSNLAEGSYTFEATSTDTAGNESVRSNAVDVTIDVTAPSTPQIDSPADNSFTSDTTPTISGSAAESGSTVTVYDALNNVICTDVADGSGNWSCDASPALAEGAYTFTAKAVDAAGNESGVSNAVDLTVDTTAPTVSLTTPANGVTYTTTTPPLNFSVTDTNSGTSECNIDNGGWNSCTSGTNLAALGQGSHTIQVRNTDLAGNIGVSATNTFTIDSIAPGAPAITSPADGTSTNDQTPTISGDSAEANSTVKVYNGLTLICQTTADGAGNWSCTPGSNLAEGSYTFEATSTDGAGNESARSNAVDVTIDVTAPAAPQIDSPADNSVTSDSTPTISGSAAESGSTVTVYDALNNVICTDVADGAGNWSCDASPALVDGSYTFTAKAVDGAGNESGVSNAVDVTIDTTLPGAPTITSPANGDYTTDSTPTVTGTNGVPNGTVTVRDENNNVLCTTTADGSGNWSCDAGSALSEGPHTLTATTTDQGNNESAPSAPVGITVDTTAPTVTLNTPADGALFNVDNPVVTFTLTETNQGTTTCTIAGPGGPYSVSPCTSGQNLPSLPDGDFTIQVSHVDDAGNSGSSTTNDFTIDTTAPAAPTIDSPNDGDVTTDTTPTVSGSGAVPNGPVTVYEGNTVLCTTTADGSGDWSCDVSPALIDGTHTLTATTEDPAGNESPTSPPVDVTIDTTAPGAPNITGPVDNSRTNDTTPTISGDSAEANSTVKVYDGTTLICQTTADGSGNWSCDASPALAEGNYTFEATSTDGVGNEGVRSNAVHVAVDTTAPSTPTVTLTSPTSSPTNQTTATITYGGIEVGATAECRLDSGSWTTCAASPVSLSGLTEGSHTYSVRQTDEAGNTSGVGSVVWVVDLTAPAAPSITSPSDGDAIADTTPTVTGTGAEPNGPVTVYEGNIVLCTTTADGSGAWSCDVSPALSDGPHTLTATTEDPAGNESPTSSPIDVTIDATNPAVSITSPSDNQIVNTKTPQITFTATDTNLDKVECRIDGGAWTICSSPWTTSSLSEGNHTVDVRATDDAGNQTTDSVTFEVDTGAPTTTIGSHPPVLDTDTTPTFVFVADDPAATFECSIDGGAYAACTSPLTAGPLADGQHTFAVRATDTNGNTESPSKTITWTLDTTPPSGNVAQQIGSGGGGNNPTFDIATDDGTATTVCSLDGGAATPCSSPYTPAGKLAPGTHTLVVTFTDPAGNSSQKTITFVIAAGSSDPLPQACFAKGITITDLAPKGKKVTMRGFTRLGYVGQKVTIRYKQAPKKVAGTAVVQPDGSFTAKMKAPKKKLWKSNKALYQAAVGSEKTQWTKLSRRVTTASASYANGKLTVKGVLEKPLFPKAKAKITARTGCDQPFATIGETKIEKSGTFSFSTPYTPVTGVVFVKVATVVSKGGKKPRPLRTYSYVIPVILPDHR